MSTTPKLGIRVYTELGRTGGPPNTDWWDLRGIVNVGLAANGKNLSNYLKNVLSLRLRRSEKDVEDQLVALAKDKPLDERFFDWVVLDLSSANVQGNDLEHEKDAGSLSKLDDLTLSGSYADAITGAVTCGDAGCEAYQEAILTLLKNRADVRVNAYKTPGTKLAEYGQDRMPEKVKFYTRLRQSDGRPQIEVLFAKETYKTSSTHARHVEILSGILFEAGNVYCGNYHQPSQKKEATVFTHNVRQVMGIAKRHPITQTDWRNLMTLLLATDINVTTFKTTEMAVRAFTGSAHDVSSNMKVDYT